MAWGLKREKREKRRAFAERGTKGVGCTKEEEEEARPSQSKRSDIFPPPFTAS